LRALLEKHLKKMPETKAFIEKVFEPWPEYRQRRVKRVINEMCEAEEVIKSWKVLRKAGIKPKFHHEVIGLIHGN
jgi:hypothetical protein